MTPLDNSSQGQPPKLYTTLAEWWPLLSAPEDYAAEAELYRQALLEVCLRQPETLLELGSGGGNNASHLKAHFNLTLVDRSAEMLAISQRLNPECEHIQGDMRTVRLDRQFDLVFVHDAIMYMTSQPDLQQAIESAFLHCQPGGAALFVPDCVRETFQPYTSHGGHDGLDRGMRYLQWIYDPDPSDTTYNDDIVYLMRDAADTHLEHDLHLFGLFSTAEWLQIITAAGFNPRQVEFDLPDAEGGWGRAFLGMKPASSGQGSQAGASLRNT
ncbi:MAG TPA: class I SAM-dependent methyltransferase [Anaerolineales bacterium]|nr:class I SAM-dependent methyltransferase [Anaerolineales bacterium]